MSKIVKLIVAGVVAVVLVITVGTYAYINVFSDDAPEPLALTDSTTASTTPGATTAPGSSTGDYSATSASQVGYRVKENLFGQDTEGVGRTNKVTGSLDVDGLTLKSADLSVDMTSVTSDKSQRDNQFRGRIMETSKYPTATYKLKTPITLPAELSTTPTSVQASGDLTVHGVTNAVTTTLQVVKDGNDIKVQGSIPITFGDYDIENPSFGGVSTDDNGKLELLVVFAPS